MMDGGARARGASITVELYTERLSASTKGASSGRGREILSDGPGGSNAKIITARSAVDDHSPGSRRGGSFLARCIIMNRGGGFFFSSPSFVLSVVVVVVCLPRETIRVEGFFILGYYASFACVNFLYGLCVRLDDGSQRMVCWIF